MMNAVELKDIELNLVNGGDYGDAYKDNGAEPRYKVGDTVEVYTTGFHITTHREKIAKVEKTTKELKLKGKLVKRPCWLYTTENGETFSADHIES